MQQSFQPTPAEELQSLLSSFSAEQYAIIEKLHEKSTNHIIQIKATDPDQLITGYINLCEQLLGQVGQYMRLRKLVLLPYFRDLLKKEDDNHDCRSCSSSCSIRHELQVSSMRDAHQKIKQTIYQLRSDAALLTEADSCRALLKSMKLLDTVLTEVIFMEEASLIPKVLEAQKAIHAHS